MADDESSPNTLGLAFDKLKVDSKDETATPVVVEPPEPVAPEQSSNNGDDKAQATDATHSEDKKRPYINPERVKTGGVQRDKPTEDELTERMARMKEQNNKIKQRRLDVEADEAAFKKMQEAERAKVALSKKVQENVNRTREQNAQRKMDKIQSREWDSGKSIGDRKSTGQNKSTTEQLSTQAQPESTTSEAPHSIEGQWQRGGPRGRPPRGGGRGRGRGRGSSSLVTAQNEATIETSHTS